MNKEEKEAIREIKETKFMLTLKQEENFDIILNLIDKLQKDNEELKNDNEVLAGIVYCGRQVQIPYTTHLTDTSQFISKDKIKDKIKVFKKEGSQTSLIIASVLEELLGE